MTEPESGPIRLHEEPELFREVVRFTARDTSFPLRLIEKDYFGSVMLELLTARADGRLVFKGGACLAKVHAGFYRLSEDLDFVIPMPLDARRSERSKQAARLKKVVAVLTDGLPGMRTVQPLTGANNSTQYGAVIGYHSLLTGVEETIKIEVGLREPLLLPVVEQAAQTLVLNPLSHESMVPVVRTPCIAKLEAFAEKFRAALSRREVAIRDFFDIDYGVRKLGLQPTDEELVGLVRSKLAVPGNYQVDVSEQRRAVLQRQLEAELRPVLRERDFQEFDLERAFAIVAAMAERVR
jgi:predicted nucleotidyltransferase component of viral defense system